MSGDLSPKLISAIVCLEGRCDDLVALHREISGELEQLDVSYEVMFVLGPRDTGHEEVLDQLRREDGEHVRVIQLRQVVGSAAMLRAASENARGEILITVPPRFEVDLACLRELYEAVRQGADLAFASRNTPERGGAARRQSRFFNRIVSWASGIRFNDIASGTRVMRPALIEEIALYGDFDRYIPVLADHVGLAVAEIPSRPNPRVRDPGLHAPRLYLWRAMDALTLFFLRRFTRRPLRLFGGIGAAFGLLGGIIVLTLGVERLLGVPLADRPLLILGVLLLGFGAQAFTIGLLGELILFIHARNLHDYRIGAIYESGAEGPER